MEVVEEIPAISIGSCVDVSEVCGFIGIRNVRVSGLCIYNGLDKIGILESFTVIVFVTAAIGKDGGTHVSHTSSTSLPSTLNHSPS